MIYINKYATSQEVQDAIDNQELSKPYVAYITNEDKIDWNGKDIDYAGMYLTIEALETGTFYVRNADVSYSVNGGAWETTTGETALALNIGDTVRFKGTTGGRGLLSGNTLTFNAYGNIESLEYEDNFIGQTQIRKGNAFESMFKGCTNLMTAPELPATTLITKCYCDMFMSCTSLTTAPVLPAPSLAQLCYLEMFWSCSSLNYIKCLATDISGNLPLKNWVAAVSPTGTFVKKAGVEWPTGRSGIPEGWTVIEE